MKELKQDISSSTPQEDMMMQHIEHIALQWLLVARLTGAAGLQYKY
jgi:hypothetical protein